MSQHVAEVIGTQNCQHCVTGEHGCWIQPVASPQTLQTAATLFSALDLTVTLPRLDGQHEVRSDITELDLLPAFHVYNTELHLTTLSPLASIRVATLPKVMEHIKVTVFKFLSLHPWSQCSYG